VFLDSEIRSFEIVESLPPIYLTNPKPGSTYVAWGDTVEKLFWEPIKSSDYYSVEIFADGKRVFEAPLYQKNEVEMVLSKYGNATWNVKIRAEASEKENATRLFGLIGETTFKVRILKPINLTSPKNGTVISGLDALKKGIMFNWNSEEDLKSSNLIISKDKHGKDIVVKKENPLNFEKVMKLKDGIYYYNIIGITSGGFEISGKEPIKFIVSPIPLLPKPAETQPKNNGVIDFDYLKTQKAIILEWSRVPGATEYEIKVFKASDNKLVYQMKSIKDTKIKIVDLKLFSRGDFRWEIKVKSIDKSINIEQDGEVLSSLFKLDIPEITGPNKKIEGLYGK